MSIQIVGKLIVALEKYNAAAEKFINKVDTGQAKSIETYRDLKNALEYATQVLSEDDKE